MKSALFLEGKEYISASRAGEIAGYSSDYIGQLCRARKISGKLIGRTWYVDSQSLLEHKKNRLLGKPPRVRNFKGIADEEKIVSKLTIAEPVRVSVVTSATPRVTTGSVTYSSDDRPLLPILSKGGIIKEINLGAVRIETSLLWRNILVREVFSITLGILVTFGLGVIVLNKASPAFTSSLSPTSAAVLSLPNELSKSWDIFVSGFNDLKNIALNKTIMDPYNDGSF